MISKIIRYYSRYVFKEFFYILKLSFTKRHLFFTTLPLSIKFLMDTGIKNLINKQTFKNELEKFEKIKQQNLKYNNDWFSNNITTWASIFDKEQIKDKNLNILEIGSYEGLSAVFFLSYFNNSQLTCVETFEGSDEHSAIDFNVVEENFNNNLNTYKDRFSLFKGTSNSFFEENEKSAPKLFDIIYIDGSHHHDDVLNDANNSFKNIKDGGIIIFDDFLKKFYDKNDLDPITAILKFIRENKSNIEIINVNYQIIIKKIN